MLASLTCLLTGCSPPPSSGAPAQALTGQQAVHLVSGLPVIELTVTHASIPHKFKVELASTPDQQEKGLMFRTAMAPDEGMIFPMSGGRWASFWMKNTVIPLDIVFIGADGRILNIAANATPYSLAPIPSAGVTAGVIELIGGRAAQLGIVAGDKVEW
jgi:uncharacterized membrane protein (UPF0127 family)